MLDRALALERELWSGEPAPPVNGAEGVPTPAETAVWIEDLTRVILRDAACGHLGSDLRATADEILLADGLAAGEGEAEQRGGSEEWDLPDENQDDDEEEQGDLEEADDLDEEPDDDDSQEEQGDLGEDVEVAPTAVHVAKREPAGEQPVRPVGGQLWMDVSEEWQEGREVHDDDEAMQVPEPAGRITIQSRPEPEEDHVFASNQTRHEQRQTTDVDPGERLHDRFNELLDARPPERQEVTDRVAYLFPRPETTEWNVSEVSYDRRRRAEPRVS